MSEMMSDQEAIETFMSVAGVDEATAIQKLEEHHGNLNEAVNAYFGEGDRSLTQREPTSLQDDYMGMDDPVPVEPHRFPPLPFMRGLDPFSLLGPNFARHIFDRGNDSNRSPFVSHPREVREIPIEVNETGATGRSADAPIIEEVIGSDHEHGPEVRGTVIIDEDEDTSFPNSQTTHATGNQTGYNFRNSEPSAPAIDDEPDYENDIEEEMIRAAIEASKQEAVMSNQDVEDPVSESHPEDAELARAVSLSRLTAEKEQSLREREGSARSSGAGQMQGSSNEMGRLSSNGRQSEVEVGSTNLLDEAEDVDDVPLVRRRSGCVYSAPVDMDEDIDEVDLTSPSIRPQGNNDLHQQQIESSFPSEWGGISSKEHDEAVMLEAAMFGGIPEGGGYHFPPAPRHATQNGLGASVGPYQRQIPHPPSPSLAAQRVIRGQQDNEFRASLQADQEKEMKAKEEAEAALAEERLKVEAMHRKLQEEKENERELAGKEASLPQEPTPDDANAVTLLVRMPDGSRRGRRFRKSDKLQCLFDFIDIGRVVKPGKYRLVRPYPRQAFDHGESSLTLDELGLTNKQEALYLELI